MRRCSYFSNLVKLCLGGLLTCIVSLTITSCDNFLSGADVKSEIEEAIAYNNAKEISALIQPEVGTGITVPSGDYTFKLGYDFEVNFTADSSYSFIKWIAVSKENPDTSAPVSEGVVFEDAGKNNTKVKITNDTSALRLIPLCEKRIAVSEESPKYESQGVSRDRPIIVAFTKELSPDNFIFSEAEIPEGAVTRADENNKIWAYTLNGETFLKNIKITNDADYSIAEHFLKPEVNGKLLTIAVNKNNPIQFETNLALKVVKVTLSGQIKDAAGIPMSTEKSWNYQINDSTVEKASVNFFSTAAEGQISAVSKEYSIGQKIAVSFTEGIDYQFVKWEYNPSLIHLEDDDAKRPSTTITVLGTSDSTQVRAVCAPRLRLESSSPVASTASSVAKNSSIILSFNQDLPVTEAALAQLEKIQITVNGESVRSNFNAPVVNGKNINFIADRANMIDVAAGQTKIVTVSIPADFYYLLEDGTKVTYGGNGKTFSYKIDETTVNKASVNFVSGQGEGQINAVSKEYSIGQKIAVAFTENADFQFIKWTYDNKYIQLENPKAPSTTVTILEKTDSEATKITAVCAPRLRLESFSPVTDAASKVAKNSSIILTFSQNIPVTEEALAQLDKIQITIGGSPVRSNFKTPVINEKTITFDADKSNMMDVAAGQTKVVTVSIPSDFYYLLEDGTKVTYGANGKSFSYKIDESTQSKAGITLAVDKEAAGTLSGITGSAQYSIEQEVPLVFNVNDGYKFTGWTITKGNPAVEVPDSEIKILDKTSPSTKMYIHEAITGVTVKANTLELPAVLTNSQTSQQINSDKSITASFNMPMDESQFDYSAGKITIRCGVDDVSSCFKPATFNAEKTEITLSPNGTALYDYARSKNAAQITVNVIFSSQLTVTKSFNGKDFVLPLKENSNIRVNYLAVVESTKPTHYALYATAKEITLQNAASYSGNKFTDAVLSSFDNNKTLQNETNGLVYIYGKYRDNPSSERDSPSGVAKVLLTVRHTNKKDGTELSAAADSFAFTKQLDGTWQAPQNYSGTITFRENEGYTEFVIKYDIPTASNALNSDGAYLFTVQVSDACKNAAEAKSFTAIKDSYIDVSGVDISNLEGNTPKDITLTYTKPVYKNVTKDAGLKYTYSCYDKNGENVDESSMTTSKQHSLGVSDVSDLKLTVKVTDEFGNEATSNPFYFPPKPELSADGSSITIQEGLEHVTIYEAEVYGFNSYGTKFRSLLSFPYYRGNKNNQIIIYEGMNAFLERPSVEKCYFVNHKLNGESVSLTTNFTNTKNLTLNEDMELPEVTIDWEKLELDEGSETEGTVYYKINLTENNYDKVWVNITTLARSPIHFTSNLFETGKTELSVCSRYPYYFCEDDKCEIWLFAVKDGEYRLQKVGTTDPGKGGTLDVGMPFLEQSSGSNYGYIYERFMQLSIPSLFDYFSCTKDGAGTKRHEYMKIFVNNVEWTYDNTTLVGVLNCYNIPVWDFDTNETSITFTQEVTSYNGLTATDTFTLPHFAPGSKHYAPKVKITRKNDSTLTLKTTEPIANNNGPHFYVTKINSTNSDAWQVHQNSGSDEWNFENNSAEQKTDGYYFSKEIPFEESNNAASDNAASDKAFLKVVSSPHNENRPTYLGPYNFSAPTIFYTGTAGSGNYDLLMKNGQSTSTLAVQSDAPVFVHTLVTKKPYSECKNWSAEKWEYLHKHIGEKYLDFSSTEHTARRYNIPVNQIDQGDCYVVIAHFSDNHTEMSEVMVK